MELELPPDPDEPAVEDADDDEAAAGAAVDVDDAEDGFEAGVLLEEAPRLSFR
ncbi:hypothetical protein GCM10020254_49930 [Streptomyces goshikiensis]